MENNKTAKKKKYSEGYFKKKNNLKIVGAIMLVSGLFCLWLGYSMSFLGYILGILLSPTGLVLFLVGSSGRVSDEVIDDYITNKMADFAIDIDNDKSYRLKLLPNTKEINLEGYKFPDGAMIKRLTSGSLRSSIYTRTKIRLLSDSLYILNREISLIYDDYNDGEVIDTHFEPKYSDIKSISIERGQKEITFMKNVYLAKTCELVIATDKQEIRLPCLDAVTTDDITLAIERQMNNWKASAEELSKTKTENEF